MPEQSQDSALDALVHAVVESGGMFHQILHHMEISSADGRSASDAPPPDEVLRSLLTGILDQKPIAYRTDLSAVAEAVSAVSSAIAEELYLVPPAFQRPNRATRRRRRRC
jgi:hypothetical protein